MKSPRDFQGIYLCTKHVDFRKAIDGLSAIVQAELQQNLFGINLFVFIARSRDRIKCLYWDKTGFAMWIKRLEEDKFCWPQSFSGPTLELTSEQLEWLLDGIDIFKLHKHKALYYSNLY